MPVLGCAEAEEKGDTAATAVPLRSATQQPCERQTTTDEAALYEHSCATGGCWAGALTLSDRKS